MERRLTDHEVLVTVESNNIGDKGNLLRALRSGARDGVGVFGGQEWGDQKEPVDTFVTEEPRFSPPLWTPETNPGRKTTVLVDQVATPVVRWTNPVIIQPGDWLGHGGAGPDYTEEKRETRAMLALPNGRRLYVKDMHAVPSAFNMTRVSRAERQRRREVWDRQMTAFFTDAAKSRRATIGMGDLNAGRFNIALSSMAKELCPDWTWDITAGVVRIGHREDPRIRVVSTEKLDNFGSDHPRVRVTYAIAGRL